MNTVRPSPVFIFYDMRKWLPLLAVPLLRILLSLPEGGMQILISSIRDIGVAAWLILYSAVKWFTARYHLGNGYTLTQGLLSRRQLRLPPDEAATIESDTSLFLWLFRARRLRVNTAGRTDKPDAVFYVSAKTAKEIMKKDPPATSARYGAKLWPIIMLAASGSNAAFGLITLAPVVYQIADIIGSAAPRETQEHLGRIAQVGLPPLLENLAGLFIWGWALAFIFMALRYGGFHAERGGQRLHIAAGVLTRREFLIKRDRVTELEWRQTLLMRLFSLHTVSLTAAGYGREKGTRPILVPAASKKETESAVKRLLPDFPETPVTVRPQKSAVFQYLWQPLAVSCITCVPLFLGGIWQAAGLYGLGLSFWWLAVRWIGFRRAGIGISEAAVTLRYARIFSFYEIQIPRETADAVILRRPVRPGPKATCSVAVQSYREKQKRHHVYGLPLAETEKLIQKYY